MKFLTPLLLSAILITGCRTPAPVIIEREVPVPGWIDTVESVITFPVPGDTIKIVDTIEVVVKDNDFFYPVYKGAKLRDSDTLVTVWFYHKTKDFRIEYRGDTITIYDTIHHHYGGMQEGILSVLMNLFNWYEKGIMAILLALGLSIIIYLRIKKGKII